MPRQWPPDLHLCLPFRVCACIYLEILVIDAKPLSQVTKHQWTILFKFKMTWHVLSVTEKNTNINLLEHLHHLVPKVKDTELYYVTAIS